MWGEEDLSSDIAKIKEKAFTSLAIASKKEPEDPRLKWRYMFVHMLSAFEQNDFKRQKEIADELVKPLSDFISAFDQSFLTEKKESPPFDLFLLVFMVSTGSQIPNHTLLIRLFQHYVSVLGMIKGGGANVFLNDRNLEKEVECQKDAAVEVVQARLDYLAEVVSSLLYTNDQHHLLQAFMHDFCPPTFTKSEETLSQLGRMAVASGDTDLASQYFEGVKEEALKSANKGYIDFFGSLFEPAKRDFENAKARAPKNFEACAKHMGLFAADPTDVQVTVKKESAEEKTQWPARPKGKV